MESCLRKRKREGGPLEQMEAVVGWEEVPYNPEWVDISRPPDSPLPPGWEQCLDLQSGEIFYVDSATQTRFVRVPQCNMASVHGNNGNSHQGTTLGLDLQMRLPSISTSVCMPGLSVGQKIVNDPCVQQLNGLCLNSSLNSDRLASKVTGDSDMSMAATVCLHCHTFVMVSRESPHCPNCTNVCNVDFLPMTPGNRGA